MCVLRATALGAGTLMLSVGLRLAVSLSGAFSVTAKTATQSLQVERGVITTPRATCMT